MGDVGDGAGLDFAEFAVGFAEEDSGWGVAVGYGGDVHAYIVSHRCKFCKDRINVIHAYITERKLTFLHETKRLHLTARKNFGLGDLLTYVNIPDGKLTYRKWIDGIAAGRTVVSRNGHNEFLELKVNRKAGPGDEIHLKQAGAVDVEVAWISLQPADGNIEIVQDGAVVSSTATKASTKVSLKFVRSGWVCAKRMGRGGHQIHTAAVFVSVGGQPVRTSSADAEFFVRWIDNLLEKTSPGGPWAMFFHTDGEAARARYRQARDVYQQIATEARLIGR